MTLNTGQIVKHKLDGRKIIILHLSGESSQIYTGRYITDTGEYKTEPFREFELIDNDDIVIYHGTAIE